MLMDQYPQNITQKEFMAGMAEVIKYALIKNKSFFNYIIKNYKKIPSLNDEDIIKIVFSCDYQSTSCD